MASGDSDGIGGGNAAHKGIGDGGAIVLIDKGPTRINPRRILAIALIVSPSVTLAVKIGAGIGQSRKSGASPERNCIPFFDCGHDRFHRVGAGQKRGVDLGKSIATRQRPADIPDDVRRIGRLRQGRNDAGRKCGSGDKQCFFHGSVGRDFPTGNYTVARVQIWRAEVNSFRIMRSIRDPRRPLLFNTIKASGFSILPILVQRAMKIGDEIRPHRHRQTTLNKGGFVATRCCH